MMFGLKKIVRLYKDGNVSVCGMRGRGKDLLMGNVVARRKMPYISNMNYGGMYIPLDLNLLMVGNNNYLNFITGELKQYTYPYCDKADIYISIHLNSISSSTWRGAQVFYDDVNEKNIEIANLFQEQLKNDLKTTRKVKEISTMLMNRKIKVPGILIEAGFLSNPNDRYLLKQDDYQYKICESIKQGLIKYFKERR